MRSARTQRLIAWPVAVLLAAGGIAAAIAAPADVAYWVLPFAVAPLVGVAVITFENSWRTARRGVRYAVWGVAGTLAAGGLAAVLVAPGARSYLLGLLLFAPLIVLLAPIITRGEGGGPYDDAGAGGIYGPPS